MKKETKQTPSPFIHEKCPVCGSTDVRADYDFHESMLCCEQCGSDFLKDGEVILNGRIIDRPKEYKEYSESEISKGNIPLDFDEWRKPSIHEEGKLPEYDIKISGGGTRQEIAKALRLVADAIHHPTSKGDGLNVEDIDGAEWEDCTLLTEINLK